MTAAAVSCVTYVAAGIFAAAGLSTWLALPLGVVLMLLVLAVLARRDTVSVKRDRKAGLSE
jgi:4-hydroxybenzoate polyprenyltransferase